MSEVVTLELPSDLLRQARALAASTNRRFEPPVDSLPDADLLSACDSRLPDAAQGELSELLAENREGSLKAGGRERLDGLLAAYRRGLVIKARAMKEAVARGLKPRLGEHAA